MKNILLLIMLCTFVFVACSDDDDKDDVISVEKKISEITSTDKDGYKNSYKNFSYDKEGRVISYRWEDNATTLDVTYTYEKDKITRKEVEKGNDYTENIDAVYILNEKGVVISETGDYKTATYHYDKLNQLLSIESESGEDDYSFTWSNGNVIKQVYTYGTDVHETEEYTYNPELLKSFGINYFIEDNPDNILLMYGYFGIKNKNLRMTKNNNINYEYEFDSEGNVTVIKEYFNHNGTKELEVTTTITYKE